MKYFTVATGLLILFLASLTTTQPGASDMSAAFGTGIFLVLISFILHLYEPKDRK